ncbi:MAG: hypothetical protein AB7E55_05050 [Pigmentiphaga sp.]
MSKEVKRYELRIVDRYAGDGTGDIETDARMKQEARGRYVLFSDYDALLTERDALAEALQYALDDFDRWASEPGSSPNDSVLAWVAKARAALQGEQP